MQKIRYTTLTVAVFIAAISRANAQTNLVSNGGFETPNIASNSYQYNPIGGSFAFVGNAGIIDSPSGFSAPTAPDGSQIGFMQSYSGSNSSFSQSITLPTAGVYTLSYRHAGRPAGFGQGNLSYKVLLGGIQIAASSTASGQAFTQKSFQFTANAGTSVLSFQAVPSSGDNTAFFDSISIQAAGTTPPSTASLRIVNAGTQVQSRKRGVGANTLSAADFQALAPGVSWYYNWALEPGSTGTPPSGTNIEHIPMIWGNIPSAISSLDSKMAAGYRPRQVLAINEPNLAGQAMMMPQQAATLFGQIKTVTDKYNVPLSGPQMSIGSPPDMSVTAYDPIQNTNVTYTDMTSYLRAFFYYTNQAGTNVDSIGIHPYMNHWGLIGVADSAYITFQKPLWVTEYANSDEPINDAAFKLTDMIQATDYLERSPHVQGYAYFKERNSVHPMLSLFNSASGQLSAMGQQYVNLPVHDADLYYRLPGRVQSESYVTINNMEIWPGSDVDGFTHMASNQAGASANYNLQVDTAGTYTWRVRVTGAAGTITILKGTQTLASVNMASASNQYVTLQTSVALTAGLQTLTVKCGANGQGLNWMELVPVQAASSAKVRASQTLN